MNNPDQAFIERFYQEAIKLLVESRAYLQGQAVHDTNSISPDYGLFITTETTRVTARLTEIIAWLLAYKAMSGTNYLQLYRAAPKLSQDPDCMEDSVANSTHPLPHQLNYLLTETRNLYLRLLRLEQSGE